MFKSRFRFILSISLVCIFSFSVTAFDIQASPTGLAKKEAQANSRKMISLSLQNIAANIDKRISSLKLISNTIANDAHIHDWVDGGFDEKKEQILLDKLAYLVNEYGLTSASFADTESNRYWNHEGFLRVLKPEIDTWYFAYLKSGEQDLVSVYHDKNKKRVDLYVNYRQTKGNGLSGIATSFDGVIDMLAESPLSQSGELFLVDANGKIQVHPDPEITGKYTLSQVYSGDAAKTLLTPTRYNEFATQNLKDHLLVSSYIPSMDWYVVTQVDLAKLLL